MNEQEFENQDRELMNLTQSLRAPKIPDSVLQGFAASVEKRILEEQRKSFGLPLGIGIICFAILFGLVFWTIGILKAPAPKVSGVEQTTLVKSEPGEGSFEEKPQRESTSFVAPERVSPPARLAEATAKRAGEAGRGPKSGSPTETFGDDMLSEVQELTGEIEESEVVDEIEILKQLEQWTDEDDIAAGIAAEELFNDLDVALDSENASIGTAVVG